MPPTGSGTIVRRYFVVNGFDGALTMLGIVMVFYASGAEQLKVIMLPLWLANAIDGFPVDPLIASVIVTLIIIFLLGVFLGRIGASFWLWAGLRTLLLALLTCGIILLVSTV